MGEMDRCIIGILGKLKRPGKYKQVWILLWIVSTQSKDDTIHVHFVNFLNYDE